MGLLLNPHPHLSAAASEWLRRWAHLLPAGASVLDVACGSGRHLRWLAERRLAVTGVDRVADALQGLESIAELVVADLEQGPWPFAGRQFDAVLVANYLWRPLFPALFDAVRPGGFYLHETFAEGQQTVGRPRRPEFLLQPGELLRVCAQMRVIAYEDGFEDAPARFVQRIVARRPAPGDEATPPRLPLVDPARAGG